MNFAVLPPEINSARLTIGAGLGPMLEAANAWQGLAGELGSAASAFSSVTTDLVSGGWQGAASTAMASAAAPYLKWLTTAAAQAGQAATQVRLAAAAFEAALAATVHPAAISANRSQFVSLVVSNLLGQNAPAIAAAEAAYEQMWAQDVAAMFGYRSGAESIAAALTPFPLQAAGSVVTANLGFANVGFRNFGNGNVGDYNLGSGNLGSENVGSSNIGSGNIGFGNSGPALTAALNNIGFGNTGSNNIGFGNTGNNNIGFGNTGDNNIGFGNTGNGNFGFGNTGNGNI
ncbi:PPE family protein, partial [Mycobacterium marinum]|uniref:PPE family protein n=1 Tax=Mycobacterium marinum TaxID=1781 RepID=UPI003564C610